MAKLRLDGNSLTLADLAPIFRGILPEIEVAAEAMQSVERCRAVVDKSVASRAAVYGLTTGFGKLKTVGIDRRNLGELQENLILSHCCGVGEPMPIEEVRAVQVLRLNALVRGYSGVRSGLIERLCGFYRAEFVPVVPQKGSVGASGDLAPLAHMAAAYMGYGEVFLRGERMAADKALREAGEEPLHLMAKEGLALINGTEVMGAIGAGVVLRALDLSRSADAIAALTIEALFGSVKPFDARLADLKGQPGHVRTAENVRRCLADSQIMKSHADCGRVQDPYSLRCVPQVHGAFKEALDHVHGVLRPELNSVTDNPIIFSETEEVISAGQFHGQPISMAMDYLNLALCTLSNISERRTEQLVNPDLSALPGFLTARPGLNSGMMIAQVAAASLASENKSLAHPASIDTIPTSANQEDHVSMGVTAARKARAVCTNVEWVLAIEALCATQARDFHSELKAGQGAQAVYDLIRAHVPSLERDRYLKDDLDTAFELLGSGLLLAGVEKAVGELKS
ncbi:MAG: histidine ammonia-lyase [Planctomycetes bacterium]|nr:histidine ammonia-lyase [Planctomycetota bacterium]